MTNAVGPWSELAQTRFQTYQNKLPEIRRWREQEYAAGRPSGLEDFFRTYGLCFTCKTTGTRLSPVDWRGHDERARDDITR
jgi:hypothetical protein